MLTPPYPRVSTVQLPGEKDEQECSVCHCILHYSAVRCENNRCSGGKGRLVCLHHSDQLCECGSGHHQMLFRHTLAELEDTLAHVKTLAEK